MAEWRAREYSQQSSLQQAMADEVLGGLVLRGNERVMDVGCGDGKITAAIAARVPAGSVLGIDPSQDMIAFAANRFDRSAHRNLRFEVADVRHLAFHDEFDLVVSFNALHWVPEQADALAAIHRALVPGGSARLRFVSKGARLSIEDVIEEVRKNPRWADSFSGFHTPYAHPTLEAYRRLAEEAGLRVAALNVLDKAWDFESREAFTAFANATFIEWTRRLPENQWPAFITDVLDRYQLAAANGPSDANTFKFYQLEIALLRPA